MEDSDVDRYLKESCHSFKEAKVKNSARRNSLMKKTLGIENERKMANAQLNREEKLLREQLKQMKMGKRSSLAHKQRDDRKSPVKQEKKKSIPSGDVDPYPVTFASRTPSPPRKGKFEEKGRMYAARRHRRVSKEFEDLHVNTSTGNLLAAKSLHSKRSVPPALSPSIARRIMGSQSSLSSSDDLGDPEAIGSVRRSRRSVVQQEQERQLQRSRTAVSPDDK